MKATTLTNLSFDYVIVGAGPAGCVLAARLSEDANTSVALIEAGGSDTTNWVTMPAGLIGTVPTKRHNWAFETVPQAGLNGRKGYQPRGKVMGGSSSINAMCYVRGHASDYDAWAAEGCTGWSWNDVLPYFIKSEGNLAGIDNHLHGTKGPLKVSKQQSPSSFNEYFLKAAVQCGFNSTDDFNGDVQDGVGYYHVMQENGVRCNAVKAYLTGTESRTNLSIFKNTNVNRVVIENNQAKGIECSQTSGQSITILANREVILSAGAFGSPQLLMLSGVGPKEHLSALGIPVIADRSHVGKNLQDHLDCLITRRYNDDRLFGPTLKAIFNFRSVWQEYKHKKTGKIASNFSESGGFIRTKADLDKPDVQLHFVVAPGDNHGRTRHWGQGYALHVCNLRPYSRGTVSLASSDPALAPLIDPNFLSDDRDLQTMVRAYRAGQAILQSEVFADVRGKALVKEPALDDDAAIEQYLRNRSDTIYHPVGTCRMGSDADSVVDLQLRVRGVAGLRVIDASIMPTLIGGNTNAPTIMIAEKAADLLRQNLS